jgi:predicted nucleotidyltransferase
MSLALAQPQLDAIAAACRRHHVARLHAFGSALRDDFNPSHSDLDLLVEFQPIAPAALVKADFDLEGATGLDQRAIRGSGDGGCHPQSLCAARY